MTVLESMRITVGDLTFDALVAGPDDGDRVLLLHGFPQTMAMWRPLMNELAQQGYRCVAFNQRGYSRDARPDDIESYRTSALADDVVGVLDALGWDRAHLVGHDWGAGVAWRVAAFAPDRLRTLNVLSVGHPDAVADAIRADPDQGRRSEYMAYFRRPDSADALLADDAARLRAIFRDWADSEQVEETLAVLTEPGALNAALHWYRAAGANDYRDTKIGLPVLFIWSTQDVALGRTSAERTGDHVAGPYCFVVLEGVGHWIVEEAPGRVLAELTHHFSSHRE